MDELKSFLQDKQSIVVILPPNPSSDMVAAGLSLHQTLKNSGKDSQIGCSPPLPRIPNLDEQDEIVESIGSKNLIISFDYPEEYLEKVDYDVLPGGKFCLMIRPKDGSPVPKTSDVKYSYSGANADLVIVFGINSLEELGKIYADEKKFLDSTKILSLNITGTIPDFTPNVFHHPLSSFAELVTLLLEKTSLVPAPPAASNLIRFIYEITSNLTSPKTNAETFSSISFLMKNGGRLPNQSPANPFASRFSPPAFFEPHPSPVGAGFIPPAPTDNDSAPVPSDWTAPKIFRANS